MADGEIPITDKHPELLAPCTTADELHEWVRMHVGLNVPRAPLCPNHDAPFDYLWRAYHEPAKDLVVWASRGGGKTRLAAVATLLDLLHKPGCAIRILGGSFEQSRKMWDYLMPDLERLVPDLLEARITRATRFIKLNRLNSSVAVLTQSERAVRGLRVQKLRCDEVDDFTPRVWEAAQLTTRSIECGSSTIAGTVEAISTYHKLNGLMGRVIDETRERNGVVLHWCLMDVLERCPPARDCGTCPIWSDCQGRAKTQCNGFFKIDDAIYQKQRVSIDTWEAEMLCLRPKVSGAVFPYFQPEIHVRELPTDVPPERLTLAIDFGFRSPFVCLWIVDDGIECHVIDEYVQSEQIVANHIEQIRARTYGDIKRLCCDPAGNGRNDQTALSNVALLKEAGYHVVTRHSPIIEGLERIRVALRPAAGAPTLFIRPKCVKLIAALKGLHYPPGGGELPEKDGAHDHLIDALRYFYVNRKMGKMQAARRY